MVWEGMRRRREPDWDYDGDYGEVVDPDRERKQGGETRERKFKRVVKVKDGTPGDWCLG